MTDRDTKDQVRRSKVARVIEAYNLDGLGDQLARSWHGDGAPKRSLRELADLCNRELLAETMDNSELEPIEGEVDNTYRLLTGGSVPTAARTEAENRLKRAGIDLDSIRRDFVSHQAIHTYLTKYRDVEPPNDSDSPADTVEKRIEVIQRLRNKLVAVAERTVEQLSDAGHVSIGSFDVVASLALFCNECGTSHDLVDVLAAGGCDCQRSSR